MDSILTQSQTREQDAEVPAGQESMFINTASVPADPYKMPENHPYRLRLDEGLILFRSPMKSYAIPLRNPIHQMIDGQRIVKDRGLCINFTDGEYWANPKKMVKTATGERDEVTVLRELVRRRKENGDNYPIEEVTPAQLDSATAAPESESNYVDTLERLDIQGIRDLFTVHEISEHKLERATKDKLIITALRLKKALPQGL